MKKIIICLLLSVIVVAGSIFGYNYHLSRNLKISASNLTLVQGAENTISLNTNRKTKWESTNPQVASVKDGHIKALSKGTTIIKASAIFNTLECKVVVENPEISEKALFLPPNSTKKIFVSGTSQKVKWTSTNRNILVENGIVKTLEPCIGTIAAKISNKTFLIPVNVLHTTMLANNKQDKGAIFPVVLDNCSDKNIQWKVKKNNIVEEMENHDNVLTLKAINVGKTKVVAKSGGKKYQQTIWISGDQGFSIEGKDVSLNEECKLSIKNCIPSYKISWEGVKDSKGDTAYLDTSKRGKFHVKATIDTGISKDTVEKDITVRHRILNMTSWEAKIGDKTTIEMQDAIDPQYKWKNDIIQVKGHEVTALKAGETDLIIRDGNFELSCHITIKDPQNPKIIDSAKKVAQTIVDNDFKYSNSNTRNSIQKAIDESRVTNCALLVSFVMQDAGYLSEGNAIYYKDGLKGGGASEVLNNPSIDVSYPDKKPKECNLQEGDICGFMLSGGKYPHMAIYAGTDASGNLLWYTGGRDATSGGKFNSLSKIGPRTQSYYNEVQILLRCK